MGHLTLHLSNIKPPSFKQHNQRKRRKVELMLLKSFEAATQFQGSQNQTLCVPCGGNVLLETDSGVFQNKTITTAGAKTRSVFRWNRNDETERVHSFRFWTVSPWCGCGCACGENSPLHQHNTACNSMAASQKPPILFLVYPSAKPQKPKP